MDLMMKKRFITTIFVLMAATGLMNGQTLDDIGRLSIKVQKPIQANIPEEARNVLDDRMHQIISVSGISDNGIDNRFAMSVNVSVLTKDIISGSPSRLSQKLEVSFYVKDVIDNKTYGSVSINAIGIGLNENKSFIAAFSNIKADNAKIQNMIDESKQTIIEYYRTNADKFIKEAYTYVGEGQFDNALYHLAKVPDVCTDAYDKCLDATLDIYQKKIDAEGRVLLNKAKSSWAQSPDADGAVAATGFLEEIDILADCIPEVNSLIEEMKAKVKDDQKKAWEFKLQQYSDKKAREQRDFEFKVRQYEEFEAKEERRHQEEVAREQRDFEFSVHQFDENMGFKRAIVDASKETILGVAGATKK